MTSLALNFIYPFPINTKNKRLAGVNQKLSSGSYLPLNMSYIGRHIPSRRPNKPKEICGNTISTHQTQTRNNNDDYCPSTSYCTYFKETNTCTGKSTTLSPSCMTYQPQCGRRNIPSYKLFLYK